MGICPNCGSWVDEGDICMGCGGSSRYGDEEEEYGDSYTPSNSYMPDELGRQAWELYMDFEDELALHIINRALKIYDKHSNNWNKKAIILEGLKRYEESEKCYDKSLERSAKKLVYENKARMLYDWASQLFEESKKLEYGMTKLDEAKQIIKRAIDTIPKDSEEDINKYLDLRDSINTCITYKKAYHNIIKSLKKENEEDLFTITGMQYYKSDIEFNYRMPLKLVRERDNEFDRDAIAVYADGEKIGYVANNYDTKFKMTSSASNLQYKIPDVCPAQYLFHLKRYGKKDFHIGVINLN